MLLFQHEKLTPDKETHQVDWCTDTTCYHTQSPLMHTFGRRPPAADDHWCCGWAFDYRSRGLLLESGCSPALSVFMQAEPQHFTLKHRAGACFILFTQICTWCDSWANSAKHTKRVFPSFFCFFHVSLQTKPNRKHVRKQPLPNTRFSFWWKWCSVNVSYHTAERPLSGLLYHGCNMPPLKFFALAFCTAIFYITIFFIVYMQTARKITSEKSLLVTSNILKESGQIFLWNEKHWITFTFLPLCGFKRVKKLWILIVFF